MKAGYLQFCPSLNDLDATLKSLDQFLTTEVDSDLIVLPELCNSGYNFSSKEEAHESAETADNSRFIRFLKDKARQLNCHIVSGFNELDKGKLFNSAVLVNGSGLQGLYRKIHLFNTEKLYFQPGDLGLPVFDIGLAKIGMVVCFDWVFPEAWRTLALEGADIICHPSNLVLPGFAQQAVPVHGLTNRVFVITANRTGTEENLTFTGRSLIADPKGKVLSQAGESEAAIKVQNLDIELARDKQITPQNHLFQDRRPEEYK
jgi:predicted amidohydrolase